MNARMADITVSVSKTHMKIAGAVAALVLVSPVLLAAVDVYAAHWNQPTLMKVAKTLSFPVISIDGERLSFGEYENELSNLERILRESNSPASRTEMQRMLVDRLTRAAAVKRLVAERNLRTEEAAKLAKSMTFGDKMSDVEIEKAVKEQFGWSMSYFERNVLMPFARELAFALDVLKPKIDEVAAAVRAPGADFAKIAKEKGEDGSKDQGGDLGFFGKGAMVPEFESQVWNAPKGEVVGPFASRFGWHVAKVTDAKGEGDAKEVKASHIIVALKQHEADIEPLVVEAMKQVKVNVWLKE